MGRPIRRGSKGIALLCSRNGRGALRYVFDVSDTVRLEYSLDPNPFVYQEQYEDIVSARLDECFHIPADKGLANQLIHLAVQFSEEHWRDFKQDILYSVHDSLLDGLDETNVAVRLQGAMTVSLAFLLLSRCGFDLDSYFTPDDFGGISDFNAKDIILALGNGVCNSAGIILRQIEYAIRQYERDVLAGKPATVPKVDVAA